MRNGLSIWTQDRIETLTKLWARGDFSCSGIAEIMGAGLTRNSIIGKIHRLGLTGKFYSRTYRRRTPEQIEATKRLRLDRRNERRQAQRVSFVMVKRINLEALRCVEVEPMHKSLIELDPDGCRYPYGDNPFTFCNHTQFEGSKYCGPHMALTRRGAS